MNRRSVKIHTLIIISSILFVALEYGCYYFLNLIYPSYLIATVLGIILCHFFLESSLSYQSCFILSLCSVLLSSAMTVFIYVKQTGHLLIYRPELLYIILLNWLIPLLYAIIRNLGDRGPRLVNFRSFFWKTSIIFLVLYVIAFVLQFVVHTFVFPQNLSDANSSFIPFMATASYIEDCIYINQSIGNLLLFIGKALIYFIPVGFYAALLLKEKMRLLLPVCSLIFPLIPIVLTYSKLHIFCIDTYLYCFFGFLIGIIVYQIINALSKHFLKTDFLAERNKYSFFNFYYN